MKHKKAKATRGAIPEKWFTEMAERDKEFLRPIDPDLKDHWCQGKEPENAWSRAWLANNARRRRAEVFTLLRGNPQSRKIGLSVIRLQHKSNKAQLLSQEAKWFADWSKRFDEDL